MIKLIENEINKSKDSLNECLGYLNALEVDFEQSKREQKILKEIVYFAKNYDGTTNVSDFWLKIRDAEEILKNSLP